jgi:hypothetical protein
MFYSMALNGTVKPPEHIERLLHRPGIKVASSKNPFPKSGEFLVPVQVHEPSVSKFSDTQLSRTRPNVYGSENRHLYLYNTPIKDSTAALIAALSH